LRYFSTDFATASIHQTPKALNRHAVDNTGSPVLFDHQIILFVLVHLPPASKSILMSRTVRQTSKLVPLAHDHSYAPPLSFNTLQPLPAHQTLPRLSSVITNSTAMRRSSSTEPRRREPCSASADQLILVAPCSLLP